MMLIDFTHTSHTLAQTGIQRVARALYRELCPADGAVAVCFDPHLRAWRKLEPWEAQIMSGTGQGSAHRRARWPLRTKLRGGMSRLLGLQTKPLEGDAFLAPELFSASTARAYPQAFAATRGPRVAVFYDAVVLKFPELSPVNTVARFPGYMRELLAFDGIAAISRDSQQSLLEYWRWLGVTQPPPVAAIPLGLDLPDPAPTSVSSGNSVRPTLLFIGSIEGRKNHLALLTACEELWRRGLNFELHLIGLSHPQTGRAALEKLRALQAAGHPLRYEGAVSDDAVRAAYRECTFTVYPSLFEGFGLPVLESLSHGKPCVCSGRGALGEAAQDGGCLTLASVDAASLAGGIARLLEDPALRQRLAGEARARTFKSWTTYAGELRAFTASLHPAR